MQGHLVLLYADDVLLSVLVVASAVRMEASLHLMNNKEAIPQLLVLLDVDTSSRNPAHIAASLLPEPNPCEGARLRGTLGRLVLSALQ